MKITEKMLLEGYLGIYGYRISITIVSEVKGKEIRWTYRQQKDGIYQVVTEGRKEATSIMLTYNHDGYHIPLDEDLPPDLLAVASTIKMSL